jgi:uncharacterized membrane protein (UPF0127 family)
MAGLLALVVACSSAPAAQFAMRRGEVVFPDKTRVAVEIADTDALRQRGLMFREKLGPAEGMVFLFDEPGYHAFWMKNTLIPLDMIWLDATQRIVGLLEWVPPCKADPCPSYIPSGDLIAASVVEVQAGFIKRHGVKVGDRLQFVKVGGGG